MAANNQIDILITAVNQTKPAINQIKADIAGFKTSFNEVKGSIGDAGAAIGDLSARFRTLSNGFLLLKGFDFFKNLAGDAARVQALGTVLHQVAANAGITAGAIDKVDKSVQALGITAQDSRESLAKFVQAGLQVADAAKLARAAQDLAVISGENSSQTFAGLTQALGEMSIMMLRYRGIMVTNEEAQARYAAQTGKSVAGLADWEKKQALLNAVLEKSKGLTGIYEAAMGDVGKQASSLSRYQQEASVAIQNGLVPAYQSVVTELTKFLVFVRAEADATNNSSDGARSLGDSIRGVASAFRETLEFAIKHREVILRVAEAYAALKVTQKAASIGSAIKEQVVSFGKNIVADPATKKATAEDAATTATSTHTAATNAASTAILNEAKATEALVASVNQSTLAYETQAAARATALSTGVTAAGHVEQPIPIVATPMAAQDEAAARAAATRATIAEEEAVIQARILELSQAQIAAQEAIISAKEATNARDLAALDLQNAKDAKTAAEAELQAANAAAINASLTATEAEFAAEMKIVEAKAEQLAACESLVLAKDAELASAKAVLATEMEAARVARDKRVAAKANLVAPDVVAAVANRAKFADAAVAAPKLADAGAGANAIATARVAAVNEVAAAEAKLAASKMAAQQAEAAALQAHIAKQGVLKSVQLGGVAATNAEIAAVNSVVRARELELAAARQVVAADEAELAVTLETAKARQAVAAAAEQEAGASLASSMGSLPKSAGMFASIGASITGFFSRLAAGSGVISTIVRGITTLGGTFLRFVGGWPMLIATAIGSWLIFGDGVKQIGDAFEYAGKKFANFKSLMKEGWSSTVGTIKNALGKDGSADLEHAEALKSDREERNAKDAKDKPKKKSFDEDRKEAYENAAREAARAQEDKINYEYYEAPKAEKLKASASIADQEEGLKIEEEIRKKKLAAMAAQVVAERRLRELQTTEGGSTAISRSDREVYGKKIEHQNRLDMQDVFNAREQTGANKQVFGQGAPISMEVANAVGAARKEMNAYAKDLDGADASIFRVIYALDHLKESAKSVEDLEFVSKQQAEMLAEVETKVKNLQTLDKGFFKADGVVVNPYDKQKDSKNFKLFEAQANDIKEEAKATGKTISEVLAESIKKGLANADLFKNFGDPKAALKNKEAEIKSDPAKALQMYDTLANSGRISAAEQEKATTASYKEQLALKEKLRDEAFAKATPEQLAADKARTDSGQRSQIFDMSKDLSKEQMDQILDPKKIELVRAKVEELTKEFGSLSRTKASIDAFDESFKRMQFSIQKITKSTEQFAAALEKVNSLSRTAADRKFEDSKAAYSKSESVGSASADLDKDHNHLMDNYQREMAAIKLLREERIQRAGVTRATTIQGVTLDADNYAAQIEKRKALEEQKKKDGGIAPVAETLKQEQEKLKSMTAEMGGAEIKSSVELLKVRSQINEIDKKRADNVFTDKDDAELASLKKKEESIARLQESNQKHGIERKLTSEETNKLDTQVGVVSKLQSEVNGGAKSDVNDLDAIKDKRKKAGEAIAQADRTHKELLKAADAEANEAIIKKTQETYSKLSALRDQYYKDYMDRVKATKDLHKADIEMASKITSINAGDARDAAEVRFTPDKATLGRVDASESAQKFQAGAASHNEELAAIQKVEAERKALIRIRGGDEKQVAAEITQVETDSLAKRLEASRSYFSTLATQRDEAKGKWKQYANEVIALDKEIRSNVIDTNSSLRDTARTMMSSKDQYADKKKEMREYMDMARAAAKAGDFDQAKEMAKKSQGIAKSLAGDEGATDKRASVDESMKGQQEAGNLLNEIMGKQKNIAAKNRDEQMQMVNDITEAMKGLAGTIKDLSTQSEIKLNPSLDEGKLREVEAQLKGMGQQQDNAIKARVELDDLSGLRKQVEDAISKDPYNIQVNADVKGSGNSGGENTNPTAPVVAKADGGIIQGIGTGTSDSIPAMLSHGEFVVKQAAVDHYGQPFLDLLNSKALKFATGGVVGLPASPWANAKTVSAFADGGEVKKSALDKMLSFMGLKKTADQLNPKNRIDKAVDAATGGSEGPTAAQLKEAKDIEAAKKKVAEISFANGGQVPRFAGGGMFGELLKVVGLKEDSPELKAYKEQAKREKEAAKNAGKPSGEGIPTIQNTIGLIKARQEAMANLATGGMIPRFASGGMFGELLKVVGLKEDSPELKEYKRKAAEEKAAAKAAKSPSGEGIPTIQNTIGIIKARQEAMANLATGGMVPAFAGGGMIEGLLKGLGLKKTADQLNPKNRVDKAVDAAMGEPTAAQLKEAADIAAAKKKVSEITFATGGVVDQDSEAWRKQYAKSLESEKARQKATADYRLKAATYKEMGLKPPAPPAGVSVEGHIALSPEIIAKRKAALAAHDAAKKAGEPKVDQMALNRQHISYADASGKDITASVNATQVAEAAPKQESTVDKVLSAFGVNKKRDFSGTATVGVRAATGFFNEGGKVPALVSHGEFRVSPDAVNHYGAGLLSAINEMSFPKFAEGGMIGSTSSMLENAPEKSAPVTDVVKFVMEHRNKTYDVSGSRDNVMGMVNAIRDIGARNLS